jgi:hypothetical protein
VVVSERTPSRIFLSVFHKNKIITLPEPIPCTMSFSREPVSDQCKEQTTRRDTSRATQIKMNPIDDVFDSEDFGNFLNTVPTGFLTGSSSVFLSKDVSLPSLGGSIFKSKDAFSSVFSSKDWEMQFSIQQATKSPPLKTLALPPLKTMPMYTTPQETFTTMAKASSTSFSPDVFSSKDWLPEATLGSHVDVPISSDMFTAYSDVAEVHSMAHDLTSSDLPSAENAFDSLFFSKMQLTPPMSPEYACPEDEDSIVPQDLPSSEAASVPDGKEVSLPALKSKKKRKRAPRKKPIPEVKEYVEPEVSDVLLGRGGRSNHHLGNKRYREEVKNLKQWYSEEEDKNKKTDLSQMLVDYVVHNLKGRFLEEEKVDEKGTDRWYVVPNITARRKASQALREDNDAEKRKAKRQRFLEKKQATTAQAVEPM